MAWFVLLIGAMYVPLFLFLAWWYEDLKRRGAL